MEKIIVTKLGMVDEIASENESLQEVGFFTMEQDKYHRIELDNAFVRVPELNVDLYSGIYYNWNNDVNEYQADFSLTVVKELGCDKKEAYISWESDGFDITLANTKIAHDMDMGIEKIQNLDCEIWRIN